MSDIISQMAGLGNHITIDMTVTTSGQIASESYIIAQLTILTGPQATKMGGQGFVLLADGKLVKDNVYQQFTRERDSNMGRFDSDAHIYDDLHLTRNSVITLTRNGQPCAKIPFAKIYDATHVSTLRMQLLNAYLTDVANGSSQTIDQFMAYRMNLSQLYTHMATDHLEASFLDKQAAVLTGHAPVHDDTLKNSLINLSEQLEKTDPNGFPDRAVLNGPLTSLRAPGRPGYAPPDRTAYQETDWKTVEEELRKACGQGLITTDEYDLASYRIKDILDEHHAVYMLPAELDVFQATIQKAVEGTNRLIGITHSPQYHAISRSDLEAATDALRMNPTRQFLTAQQIPHLLHTLDLAVGNAAALGLVKPGQYQDFHDFIASNTRKDKLTAQDWSQLEKIYQQAIQDKVLAPGDKSGLLQALHTMDASNKPITHAAQSAFEDRLFDADDNRKDRDRARAATWAADYTSQQRFDTEGGRQGFAQLEQQFNAAIQDHKLTHDERLSLALSYDRALNKGWITTPEWVNINMALVKAADSHGMNAKDWQTLRKAYEDAGKLQDKENPTNDILPDEETGEPESQAYRDQKFAMYRQAVQCPSAEGKARPSEWAAYVSGGHHSQAWTEYLDYLKISPKLDVPVTYDQWKTSLHQEAKDTGKSIHWLERRGLNEITDAALRGPFNRDGDYETLTPQREADLVKANKLLMITRFNGDAAWTNALQQLGLDPDKAGDKVAPTQAATITPAATVVNPLPKAVQGVVASPSPGRPAAAPTNGGAVDHGILCYGIDDQADVRALQQALKDKGYDITVDGKFRQQTELVVEHFQADHGLTKDGKVGKATKAELSK